jgi:hypothetical protein
MVQKTHVVERILIHRPSEIVWLLLVAQRVKTISKLLQVGKA